MTMSTTTMPCTLDPRPLRITLFPEHPQTILIYVPTGQRLWLPTLPTPFDLDVVSDALDDHDVPHDTREGDRNRWWRNLAQTENDEKAARGQAQREAEAARHVQIHLSPTANTLEKQRSEVILMQSKVDDEIRQLKVQRGRAKADAATRSIYESPGVYRQREQRIADLQTTSIALTRRLIELKALRQQNAEAETRKLAELKTLRRQNAAAEARSREKRFIEKAKRHLTREQFLAIWAEIEAEDAQTTPHVASHAEEGP